MVTNVTSLLKTVKTVEDEAARGTRALEASIEAISQELRVRFPKSFINLSIYPYLLRERFLKNYFASVDTSETHFILGRWPSLMSTVNLI